MPRVSAWFVRASLCHLVFGFTVGALLLADKGAPFAAALRVLRPAHVEWGAAGRIAEIGAATSFVAHLWGRVSPAGL